MPCEEPREHEEAREAHRRKTRGHPAAAAEQEPFLWQCRTDHGIVAPKSLAATLPRERIALRSHLRS